MSLTTRALLVTLIMTFAQLFHVDLDQGHLTEVVGSAIIIVSAVVAWYGRWRHGDITWYGKRK